MYEEIWKRHDRKTKDSVVLRFDRFTVDGKPACMAWYGNGGHDRMACFFLGASHFGSKHHCLYCDEEIWPSESEMLEPVDKCPLWAKK